jgi:hypothetical protein
MQTWIVPGASLEKGQGWRIWFSRADGDQTQPHIAKVERVSDGATEEFVSKWMPRMVPGVRRSFGVLELNLKVPRPGAIYRVHIPEAQDRSSHPVREGWLKMRSLPSELPLEGLSFLFASCFWGDDDSTGGGYSGVVQDLVEKEKPAFKLLIGDQVYQDFPAAWPDDRSALDLYNTRYEVYWGARGYQDVLRSTPNFFLCDDHEFWNDYPERQYHLARTYFESGRKEFGQAALDLYQAYQQCANPGGAAWHSFTIAPVSFFVADTRSERTPVGEKEGPHFFLKKQWEALEQWFQELKGPGVLVVGQPIFQEDGNLADHSLSNFQVDYERLRRLIVQSHKGVNDERKPHQILILTGDIHCGRVSRGLIANAPARSAELWEFVTSPISRIAPYLKTPKPEKPRSSVSGPPGDNLNPIDVKLIEEKPPLEPGTAPTIHNNIGIVRMVPVGDGTVRFDLGLRCIRPYNHVHFWEIGVDKKSFPNPYAELLRKHIVLR